MIQKYNSRLNFDVCGLARMASVGVKVLDLRGAVESWRRPDTSIARPTDLAETDIFANTCKYL